VLFPNKKIIIIIIIIIITPVLGEDIFSLKKQTKQKLISIHNNGDVDKHAHGFADF
jgi:hypothetical protein